MNGSASDDRGADDGMRRELPPQRLGPYTVVDELRQDSNRTCLLVEQADAQWHGWRGEACVFHHPLPAAAATWFDRARAILCGLSHPNLARIVDVRLCAASRPFVVSECVEGQTLSTYCRDNGLTVREGMALLRSACHALAYAHSHLVVHGGIEPSSIIVRPDGSACLRGLGAAYLNAGISLHDSCVNSAQATLFAGSDIQGLGRVMRDLISRHPSSNENAAVASRSRSARSFEAIEAIIERAVTSNPREQYSSVDALDADLAGFVARRAPASRPSTPIRRALRSLREHGGGLLISTVVSLLTIAFAVQLTLERNRAIEAERNALLEGQTASEVSRFLVELFDEDAQETFRGNRLDVAGVLDRGRDSIVDRFATQPEVRSAMLHALANAYLGIGRLADARVLIEESITLRRGIGPRARLHLARSLTSLAHVLSASYQGKSAEPVAREALAILKDIGAGDKRDWLGAHRALGIALSNLGRLNEADEHFTEAIHLSGEVYGKDSREYADALLQSARGALLASGAQTALPRYEAATDPIARSFDSDHPRSLELRLGLAIVRTSTDPHGAEAAFRDLIARQLSIPGRQTIRLALAFEGLSDCLRAQGRYREAIEPSEQALALLEQLMGKALPRWASTATSLARLRMDVGDFAAAERLLREALETQGLSARIDASTRYTLGRLLLQSGRLDEAEPWTQKSLSSTLAISGPNSASTAWSRALLGELLARQGRYDEAVGELEAARSTPPSGSKLGDARRTAYIESTFAILAESSGDVERALALRKQATDRLEEVLARDHLELASARVQLARAQFSRGQVKDARATLAMALPILDAQHVEQSLLRKEAHALDAQLAQPARE